VVRLPPTIVVGGKIGVTEPMGLARLSTMAAVPALKLPAGCEGSDVRSLRSADAGAVAGLTAAYEGSVLGEVLIELADIQADWQRASTDLEHLSVGVFEAGEEAHPRLVAYAELGQDQRVEACVHPDRWGLGLGTALVRWSRAVARERGLERVGQTVPDADLGAQKLFAVEGYQRRHTSWVLALPAEQQIPHRRLPDGYAIVDFVPGRDEQLAYRVVEDAFNEWPDRVPCSYADWAAVVLGRPGFEPWQLRLAVDPDGHVVGACVLQLGDESGWVHQVAVARAHRRRGLAQALLSDAFTSARGVGRPRAELSTDSRTGALGLYEHVGMVVTSSYTHWATAP